MDSKEFRKALDYAGMTRYSFAKTSGMHWQTVDGYYNGLTPIKKKTESLIRLYTGYGEEKAKGKRKAK